MDPGKMFLMKNNIRLMDDTQFQEHYRHIPPSMSQKVHDHLKELLEIDVLQTLLYSLANLVVLV